MMQCRTDAVKAVTIHMDDRKDLTDFVRVLRQGVVEWLKKIILTCADEKPR